MTDKEKAQEIGEKCATIAMEMCSCEYECTQSALLMAKWKDEQFAKEKQELLDKACGWLNVFLNTHYIMRYKDNCEPDKSWIIEVFKRIIK